jgi:hypothetical protein
MKTTHLRIGSIVEYNDGGGDFIETRFSKADLEIYGDHETLFIQHRPVPITAERLLKNGFESASTTIYVYKRHFNFRIVLRKDGNGYNVGLRDDDWSFITLQPIHHLHELQNLMMVLFDKEII